MFKKANILKTSAFPYEKMVILVNFIELLFRESTAQVIAQYTFDLERLTRRWSGIRITDSAETLR